MKNRIAKAFLISLLISALSTTTIFAKTVEEMQADKSKTQTEVNSLQDELKDLLDRIDTLEKDISDKESEIEKTGEELEKAAAKQTEQYDSMKLRIKYMYENGDSSLIEAIFTATSFTDLINKAEYVQEVHSYDRTKLNEYVETTKQIEEMKTNLQDEYASMQSMEEELQTQKDTLNTTLEEKQAEIATLDQSIQAAIEERRREEERAREEAARQAAAAQAAAQQVAQQQAAQQQAAQQQQATQHQQPSQNTPSVNVQPQSGNGSAVVAKARQYIGYPYVYGGNSLTGGIDCSGFTQQIYAMFGVSLPRTSGAQATCGYAVPLSQAQAGDLLCYDGHVGIYNGTGGIIHASSPSVGITEFSSCQYRTLLCVRRVL